MTGVVDPPDYDDHVQFDGWVKQGQPHFNHHNKQQGGVPPQATTMKWGPARYKTLDVQEGEGGNRVV